MVQQLRDVPGHEDPGVVAVEAEPVALLLDPSMETPAVPPEADTEQILVLGGVSQQEASLWLLVQQRFCLIPGIEYNLNLTLGSSIRKVFLLLYCSHLFQ